MAEGSATRTSNPDSSSSCLQAAEFGIFAVLFAWLGAAAWFVEVEPFDGFQNICNARFFLGEADKYQVIRFPMMGLLLVPAEAIKEAIGLHPLDVRPHHLTMALLHGGYLLAVYAGLVQIFGRGWPVLLGLVSVALNWMFFGMAAFVSVDIVVGAALLWMVIGLDRFLDQPGFRTWLALVVLGFFAASIKHVFGLFWIGVLVAACIVLAQQRADLRQAARYIAVLAAGALLAAIATWCLESYALRSNFPDEPFWSRPWLVVGGLLDLASTGRDLEVQTPAWLYVRNAWAYGTLLVIGSAVGAVLAFRPRAPRVELIAVVVALVFLVAMQLTPVKNVRFLSSALPVAAVLVVVAIQFARQWPRVLIAALALALAVDLYHAVPQASRIAAPFYTRSALREFLEPVDTRREDARVYWVGEYLNLIPPGGSQLAGDQYDEIFHFGAQHLRCLYGLSGDDPAVSRPGDLLIASSHRLNNPPTWSPSAPENLEVANQSIHEYREVGLVANEHRAFEAPSGVEFRVASDGIEGDRRVSIEANAPIGMWLQPGLRVGGTAHRLHQSSERVFTMPLLTDGVDPMAEPFVELFGYVERAAYRFDGQQLRLERRDRQRP